MPDLFLKPRQDARANSHPWIYAGQVARVSADAQDGGFVRVHSAKGHVFGWGFYNSRSQIVARLFSRSSATPDDSLLEYRLSQAVSARQTLGSRTNAMRLVFSEADQLPGLIADRYNDLIVIQCLTLAIDQRKQWIAQTLSRLVPVRGVYERSDAAVREREGLSSAQGWLVGEGNPQTLIEEDGLRFEVDVAAGHKTGFYLDQRDNRALLADSRLKTQEVLDVFSYTGAFAIRAASSGAARVLAIESSESAVACARRNAERNGVSDKIKWDISNAFERLRQLEKEGRHFGVVILDPPPFARGKDRRDQALAGYKEINLRAIKLLSSGGHLLTFSCSHHIMDIHFLDMLVQAAEDAHRSLRIIRRLGQGADHPVLLSVPETEYLKGYWLQAVE